MELAVNDTVGAIHVKVAGGSMLTANGLSIFSITVVLLLAVHPFVPVAVNVYTPGLFTNGLEIEVPPVKVAFEGPDHE